MGDHFIPEGMDLATPVYALHHHERYHRDPFNFNPDRWIVDESNKTTAEDVAKTKSAFCPFSFGPRVCAGKELAYNQIMVILARLVFLFDMRLASDLGGGGDHLGKMRQRKMEFQLYENVITTHDGPIVHLRARQLC